MVAVVDGCIWYHGVGWGGCPLEFTCVFQKCFYTKQIEGLQLGERDQRNADPCGQCSPNAELYLACRPDTEADIFAGAGR